MPVPYNYQVHIQHELCNVLHTIMLSDKRPAICLYARSYIQALCESASNLRQNIPCICDPDQHPASGSFNLAVYMTVEDGVQRVLRSPHTKGTEMSRRLFRNCPLTLLMTAVSLLPSGDISIAKKRTLGLIIPRSDRPQALSRRAMTSDWETSQFRRSKRLSGSIFGVIHPRMPLQGS